MWLIILLILLGVLFLVAELVLLPGVSLGALFALVCYGSAIYTADRHRRFAARQDVAALLAETEDRVVEYAPSR